MILDPNGVAAAVSGEAATRVAAEEGVSAAVATGEAKQALLLFRAGSAEPKSVPLGAITRLEVVDSKKFELSNGRHVLQYRGTLMPIVTSLVGSVRAEGNQPVLVFTDGERAVGVAVDEILDIVEATLKVELTSASSGLLGTAVIREKATEVIDIAYHVSEAFSSWFSARPSKAHKRQVLLIDDSPFFRTMMAPLLVAAGYVVTEAATAESALKLKEEGRSFDLILSDIQMPGMDGRKFASLVKSDPNWKKTPVVGLASDGDDADLGAFDAMAQKFDRDGLMSAVRSYIGTEAAAA